MDKAAELPPRPKPPEKPLPTDCCGSGCAVCVFESYENARLEYEKQLARWLQLSVDAQP